MDFVFNNFVKSRQYSKRFFTVIITEAVKAAKFNRDLELSVNLVDEGRMRLLNKRYRGKDELTDVLSFPLGQRLNPAQNYQVDNADAIMSLGDIFICLPIARKYAKEEGVSLSYKLAFLTVHGFLHLLGYDHQARFQKEKMFHLQDSILKKLGSKL